MSQNNIRNAVENCVRQAQYRNAWYSAHAWTDALGLEKCKIQQVTRVINNYYEGNGTINCSVNNSTSVYKIYRMR